MKREEYLKNTYVRDFVNWLNLRVTGEKPFPHSYYSSKPEGYWECSSLYEAYEKYEWNGCSFAENQSSLNQFRDKIFDAIKQNDNEAFTTTVHEVLKWGGVQNGNTLKLEQWGDCALRILLNNARILEPSNTSTLDLSRSIVINAGWTKVYSLILDDFPIYDSRVAAALGYLVRQYCIENKSPSVPELLQFRWPQGQSMVNRDPSYEHLKLKRLYHSQTKYWATYNCGRHGSCSQ